MELQNILINAVGGFATGLAFGLKGFPEKLEERLELAELIPEKERENLSDKKIKYHKNRIKEMKIGLPLYAGSAISVIASYTNPNTFPENIAAAVPSAYLGRFAGAGIRKLFVRKGVEEKKNEFRAIKDVENMHKYLLPLDKSKIIDDAFSEIEKIALAEDKEKLKKESPENPSFRIYKAITEGNNKYKIQLLKWSLVKSGEIMERSMLQKDITQFYQAPYQERFGPGMVADCVLIGHPKEQKLKVFIKEGGDFYIQTIEFPNLKILRNDNEKSTRVLAEGVTKTTPREIWTDDYQALTQKFIYERGKNKDYPIMLMKIPENFPDKIKQNCIASAFFSVYESYHSSKEDKKE